MSKKSKQIVDQKRQEIAIRIKLARCERRITQEKLAEILGFSRIKLNRVENGRAELTVSEIFLLAKVCRLPVNYFFE
jgi:transcriptional regulator with XRE-family HTH domain